MGFTIKCWKDQDTVGVYSKTRRGTGSGANHRHWYSMRRACEACYYLGQIIDSHGTVKGELSRRLGLAHAAFNTLRRQGIWTDKTLSKRTKLTIYKATVLTILLYCAETWSMGPADVNK
jgi:hypothetical protein